MSSAAHNFYINTYSYKLDRSALDCVNSLSEQGYRGIETHDVSGPSLAG